MGFVAGVGRVGAGPTEGGRRAAGPMYDPSIREHRRTDPGADREKNDVRRVSRRAERRLGEKGEVGVVAERHGHAGEDEGQVLPVQIGQVRRPEACRSRTPSPGTAMPIARHAVRVDQPGDEALKGRQIFGRRPMSERRRVAFASGLRQSGAQIGAAEVEAKRSRHPLIPELTMLSTKKRCRNANRTSGGRTAMVAPAMTRFVFSAPRL